MTTSQAYLALGSNLGDRLNQLEAAAAALPPDIRLVRASRVYETKPWGHLDQPRFLNQVLHVETELEPGQLLERLKSIEQALGRQPSFRYGPRRIDIDILLYENRVLKSHSLTLPHPQLAQRAFVLVPLAELAPDLRHPEDGRTVREMLEKLDTSGVHPFATERQRDPTPPMGAQHLHAASLKIGSRVFQWGQRTYIMGVLNLTPDSFSGDGLLTKEDPPAAAIEQAAGFLDAGADILDVGGESTRPGAVPISASEELERVVPVIEALAARFDTAISIDTFKAEVAAAALGAGAGIVNDVWGLRADPEMAPLVAARSAAVILMHNRSQPKDATLSEQLGGRYVGVEYDDLIEDIRLELLHSVRLAHAAGIVDDRIVLDPGIGFGKTVEQNLELLDRLADIRSLGYPVLLGPSRKSFIGYTLDLPADQRLEGTAATVAIGIARGADIVRIHDVREMARVARMTDAIVRRSPPT